jgi:hypothetical protein
MGGSLLSISNKALRRLGIRELISLQQQGRAAARCRGAVEEIVQELLREHPFSFATDWGTFALLAEAPPFGYKYAYQAPVNSMRLIDVRATKDLRAPRINFKPVSNGVIYTDASPCYARHVEYNESDLAKAPPDFIKAAAYRLGAEIAVPLSKSTELANMEKLADYYFDRARLNDAATENERGQDENRTCTILAARGYPGYVGDYPYEEA